MEKDEQQNDSGACVYFIHYTKEQFNGIAQRKNCVYKLIHTPFSDTFE